jgi:hypothetical protein
MHVIEATPEAKAIVEEYGYNAPDELTPARLEHVSKFFLSSIAEKAVPGAPSILAPIEQATVDYTTRRSRAKHPDERRVSDVEYRQALKTAQFVFTFV